MHMGQVSVTILVVAGSGLSDKQHHGSNSGKRDMVMSGRRARTSAIQACGSMSFVLQLTIRVYSEAPAGAV